ncbi:MAG TPA: DNA primase DnaG [Candidatus Deferrimicrobium sp.]|nr:DNA primase DnaG [Candidatus Deferrimicrobium sp.]
MSHSTISTTKYIIHGKIDIEGIVEKPDVVGAIFGQTEGLLGEELDLRELQKTGRIGRIQVEIKSESGKSTGIILIPSSLNRVETSILASALETVDRVGPCTASIALEQIEDVREVKRRQIINRAANILKHWEEDGIPESQEITNEVMQSIKPGEIQKYGPENLPAGPEVEDSESIIIVEGRADILNLLRCGIKNTIAVEGTNIPKSIIELSKKKICTVFLDGDRGGDLILKEILQVADIKYVIRAPAGKEVEDLTKKEIIKTIRNKAPVNQTVQEPDKKKQKNKKNKKPKGFSLKPKSDGSPDYKKEQEPKVELPLILEESIDQLRETLQANLYDSNYNLIESIGVRDLTDKLVDYKEKVSAIVFDGVITQRLVDIAAEKNIQYLIGARLSSLTKKPIDLKIITFDQIDL